MTPSRLTWGSAVAVLLMLCGCCASHGRTASAVEADTPSTVYVAGLSSVVAGAIAQTGLSVKNQSHDPSQTQTHFAIASGLRNMWVTIDPKALSIRIGWWMSDDEVIVSKVQRAIEQEFSARYHTTLHFKDLPCGWFGP